MTIEKFMSGIAPPTDATGIAMKLSGGADSAIIYHALCKHMADNRASIPIYVVTLTTHIKPWYRHYAEKVIDFTASTTGIKPAVHMTNHIGQQYDSDDYVNGQDRMVYDLVDNGIANVVYTGLTQNPEPLSLYKATVGHRDIKTHASELARRCSDGPDHSRDDHSHKTARGINRKSAKNPFYSVDPFIHSDKRYVAQQYRELDLLDTLFPLTYSCEEPNVASKTSLGSVAGYQEHAHCGKCWYCMERVYGFGRIT